MFKLPLDKCFVVADVGINHNGDLDVAKKMIQLAKCFGVDCIKFQKRTIDVVYTQEELDRPRESPFGNTNRHLKEQLEFSPAQYDEIDKFCRGIKILWTASPWDNDSVDFLMCYDVPYIKIASPMITNTGFLRKCINTGKPLFVSTGMADQEMIWKVVNFIESYKGKVALLYHCTSTYPTDQNEINLNGIKTLRAQFPLIPIGYSGHEVGLPSSIMAAALGARSIERHMTLDRSMFGTDQAASLEPEGIRRLVRDIRTWERVRGDGIIKFYDSEQPIAAKLRRVIDL